MAANILRAFVYQDDGPKKANLYPGEGGWRWRLIKGRNKIAPVGEAYRDKRDAIRALEIVRSGIYDKAAGVIRSYDQHGNPTTTPVTVIR